MKKLGLIAALTMAQAFPVIASEGDTVDEVNGTLSAPASKVSPEKAEPEKAVPKAKPVQLDKPVLDPSEPTVESAEEPQTEAAAKEPVETKPDQQKPLVLLGAEVPPETATRLSWSPSESLKGLGSASPVLIVNGKKAGPTLCLTAAVHGDELNGIEIVRRILYQLEPEKLAGAVIGVPIVNLQGFHRSSRYLADRRDLNRHFPGDPKGNSGERIAYSLFTEVISHCDVLVDLHTGSFYRENLPQLRADLHNPDIVKLTHKFGSIVVVHSQGSPGMLRQSAIDAGIPAVTMEAGGPMALEESAVAHGVKSIQTLLNKMDMVKKIRFWAEPEPVYFGAAWVRADQNGILLSKVKLGDNVEKEDVLGVVTDPITNVSQKITSPHRGKIIGMAIDQVVRPGFAAYHIGIASEDDGAIKNPDDLDEQTLEKVKAEQAQKTNIETEKNTQSQVQEEVIKGIHDADKKSETDNSEHKP